MNAPGVLGLWICTIAVVMPVIVPVFVIMPMVVPVRVTMFVTVIVVRMLGMIVGHVKSGSRGFVEAALQARLLASSLVRVNYALARRLVERCDSVSN